MSLEHATEIIIPQEHWQELLVHCRRKLAKDYLPGETHYPRAYGLIAGSRKGEKLYVEAVMPVKKNVRSQEPYKSYMDKILTEHAVPSKTPLDQRAWMTDPAELRQFYDLCDQRDLIVIGTYHSHIVAWAHDAKRDTPTHLDTLLAQGSNFYQFIISLVDIENPVIRAFYEGFNDKETPIAFRP